MIHVRRPATPPRSLRSRQTQTARARAERFFERPAVKRAQETHRFSDQVLAQPELRRALSELFHGKCAYCESHDTGSAANHVDQFRPTFGAIALSGKFSPDHYWWLSYAWENLYWVCLNCSRLKGRRFPVQKKRAEAGATGIDLRGERALLLDPCTDDPERHLVYDEEGVVSSATEPGKVTIEVLGLNRATLVRERRQALAVLRAQWEARTEELTRGGARAQRELQKLLDARQAYAGLRRQFIRVWLDQDTTVASSVLAQATAGPTGKVTVISPDERERTRKQFDDFQASTERYSVDAPAGRGYYIATRSIRSIEIHNFRAIGDLTLDFPPTRASDTTPWLMLLGENGSGKSSVLQAVALTLMGDRYRNRLELPPVSHLIRRGRSSARVAVHLDGSPDPIELHISRRTRSMRTSEAEPKVLLLAYGATRLLPRARGVQPRGTKFANVENLFNPFVPLGNPDAWLISLDDRQFPAVARALKRLLPLQEEATLIRRRSGVEIQAYGTRLSLSELSDGYQSIVALATDIMQVLLHRWPAMEVAEGILAIDELEAHLHPRWRMKIVESLRAVFPRLQFIGTTHDPLCLRGLLDGEVAVMRRAPDREVFVVKDVPPVQGLRVDQLLTSEAFGLDSTADPEVDLLLEQYRRLRWRGKQTQAVRKRSEQLRARLDELQVLGRDAGERLLYEATEEYVAREATTRGVGARRELKEETKRKLAEILAEPLRQVERQR